MRRGAGGRRPRFRRAGALAAALAVGGLTAPTPSIAQSPPLPDTIDITRAIRIALSESPVLRISRTQADRAGADRLAAWGAFLPTANVSADLGRSSFSRTTFVGEEGLSETLPGILTSSSQNARQTLGMSWVVLDRGRRFSEISRSAASLRAAQRYYDDRQREVVLTVRRDFLEALRRQELLELTRTQIADRELELEIASRRYEIAAVERTDLLAAEGNLLNARIALAAEENQLRAGLRQLVVSMGLPPDTGQGLVLTGDDGMPEGIPDIDFIVQTAVTSDPELAALDAERAAAAASLWTARARYLPQVSVNLGWSRSENFGP
ncbi:MAG: TolC family protein, partial [Gemmatimonadales bacterium]|nr:TolC family protein [Gemmatimonadales bacterium]